MFMHGNFMHIFFNMFALWMFGTSIERIWGAKRFLIYYLVTGFGAFLLHYAVVAFQIQQLLPEVRPEMLMEIKEQGLGYLQSNRNYTNPKLAELNLLYNIPVVGASGAVFGILLAFGMMFPNTRLMLIFFPVPIKAKYFVIGYGAIELFSGIANRPGDNVAHFAHLGGMLFGYLLIKYWNKNQGNSSFRY
jgi:membrane associated rhomboid family serine protease